MYLGLGDWELGLVGLMDEEAGVDDPGDGRLDVQPHRAPAHDHCPTR